MVMVVPSLVPRPSVPAPKPQVSTTSYSDPLRAMTIKALQERQKQIEGDVPKMPDMLSPWQGVSYALDKFMHGLNEGRTNRAEIAAEQGRAALMGQIDPNTGATDAQIAQMGQFDPEIMAAMWADRAKRAQTPQWRPMTPDERTHYAIPADLGAEINQFGEVNTFGKQGGVTIQNMPETKGDVTWEQQTSKNFADRLNEYMGEGSAAAIKLQQVDALDQMNKAGKMLHGSEAMIAQWAHDNLGINIEGSDLVSGFTSIVNAMVPDQHKTGTGPMSDRDVILFKQSLPSILNSPNGNQLVIDYLRGISQYMAARGKIAGDASDMPSRREGRAYYDTELAKLANPLANLQETLRRIGTPAPATGGGGGGDPSVDEILKRHGVGTQ